MGLVGKGRRNRPELPLGGEAGSVATERPPSQTARKLKPGPGLTAEIVFADQRQRLRKAAIELAADGGYERLTVRALAQEAGVSTRTFYRQFANVTDCVGFASESTIYCALEEMKEATAAVRGREDGFDVAIASLMQYFASHPDATSVALIEAFDAGPSVLVRLDTATGAVERLFAELLKTSPDPIVPRQLVSGMVAGLLRIARATSMAGRAAELPGLASNLSAWALSLASLPSEAFRPFALIRTDPGLRSEANSFPDVRPLSSSASGVDDRERILRATVRLAAASGVPSLTVPRIRQVAGVSRKSFNGHFTSVSECFLTSVEWLMSKAAARARAWASSDPDRDRRTHRLILALCTQAARNQALAGLAFAGVLDVGRAGLLRRDRILELGATSMREELPPLGPAADLALEASVAAVWQVADAEVSAGRATRLPALSALLTHMLMTPVRSFETNAASS